VACHIFWLPDSYVLQALPKEAAVQPMVHGFPRLRPVQDFDIAEFAPVKFSTRTVFGSVDSAAKSAPAR
jgi:hypothetical protein